MMWIGLTLLYGIIKGVREIVKKKALESSTVMEVLFFYTLLGFLLLLPGIRGVFGMTTRMYLLVAAKSFVIFIAWICGFRALKRIPLSVYGVLDLSRVLFSTLLGVIVIGERFGARQIAGLSMVAGGLALLGMRKRRKSEIEIGDDGGARGSFWESTAYFILLAFISAFLNAVSGTMDKLLTRNEGIGTAQLQFWYMLFLLIFYGLYIVLRRVKVNARRMVRNYWIWILSVLFIIADRALFVANAYPESRVTVMTLLKQAGAVVTIFAGRFIFHEEGMGYKLFCAGVIIAGIVLGTV